MNGSDSIRWLKYLAGVTGGGYALFLTLLFSSAFFGFFGYTGEGHIVSRTFEFGYGINLIIALIIYFLELKNHTLITNVKRIIFLSAPIFGALIINLKYARIIKWEEGKLDPLSDFSGLPQLVKWFGW